MARSHTVNVFLIVIALLFVFSFAHDRSPVDLPENDVTIRDDESDPSGKATIILPSEKPESEPATVVELGSEEAETVTTQERSQSEVDSVPLTVITFRPINHRFPRRPFIPFRRGHRCHGRHHHHLHNVKPWDGPRFKVSYGKDMILSEGGKDLSFDPVSRGGEDEVRKIPGRWTRFNHGGHRFSLIDGAHHHEHRHEQETEHEGGLMKGIRKFLNRF